MPVSMAKLWFAMLAIVSSSLDARMDETTVAIATRIAKKQIEPNSILSVLARFTMQIQVLREARRLVRFQWVISRPYQSDPHFD